MSCPPASFSAATALVQARRLLSHTASRIPEYPCHRQAGHVQRSPEDGQQLLVRATPLRTKGVRELRVITSFPDDELPMATTPTPSRPSQARPTAAAAVQRHLEAQHPAGHPGPVSSPDGRKARICCC